MNQFLEKILKKMCSYVGVDFKSIDFHDNKWYLKHEWTQEQEEDFKDWLYHFLKKNKKAQRELYGSVVLQDKNLKVRVEMFNLSFGWKTK